LHQLHLLPSQFLKLPREEKAFIIASIQLKAEKEKKEAQKMKQNGKRR